MKVGHKMAVENFNKKPNLISTTMKEGYSEFLKSDVKKSFDSKQEVIDKKESDLKNQRAKLNSELAKLRRDSDSLQKEIEDARTKYLFDYLQKFVDYDKLFGDDNDSNSKSGSTDSELESGKSDSADQNSNVTTNAIDDQNSDSPFDTNESPFG